MRHVGGGRRGAFTAQLLAVAAMLAAGKAIVNGGAAMYATVALAAVFPLGTWLTGVRRFRELSVLVVIVVGVFNFTPALFSPDRASTGVVWL